MVNEPIPILGGKSVFCINEAQMREACRLAEEEPGISARIQASLAQIEQEFSRNEQAALAFTLIQRLKQSAEK